MAVDARRDSTRLGVELEARLLERLVVEWRSINYRYFKSALRAPTIVFEGGLEGGLEDGLEPLAVWSVELRELLVAREQVLARPWVEVLEALARAAVWQFIDERLSVDPRNRHPTFRRICRYLAIREPGAPADGASEPTPSPEQRVVARIHKLLALARSPNRHEAETAAMTARRLMFKFNLDSAGAERLGGGLGAEQDAERYGYRHLGQASTQRAEHDRRLAKILSAYFFVESVWLPVYLPREGRTGTVLEICGLEPNLLMAEHVHGFVGGTARRLCADWSRARDDAPTTHARLAFLAGVMAGFEAKLARQDEQLREQGLVWVPAPGLGEYFRRRHPKLQYTRGGSGHACEAYEQGSRAGRGIVLAPPVAAGTRRGPPRALPAAR